MSGACWPDRLIGDLPNVYLYAANNPSEGTLAKRRSGATLVSHLTPPLAKAGLYKGLLELKDSLNRWRAVARRQPRPARARQADPRAGRGGRHRRRHRSRTGCGARCSRPRTR